MTDAENFSPQEIAKFEALSEQWWDKEGSFKTLHQLNPLRLAFIEQFVALDGLEGIDVGCGGGILTETLALKGVECTGIDLSPQAIRVAQAHAQTQDVHIHYQVSSVDRFAPLHAEEYDLVTCMELIEHVPDPFKLIQGLATLLSPGGHLFLSTLNRTPKAFLHAILGAEFILKWLPVGTHEYRKFLKPSECRKGMNVNGIQLKALQGVSYHPLKQSFYMSQDLGVNYLIYGQKIQKAR